MSLAGYQEALARLLVDPDLRRRALAGERVELPELELDADERASLLALDAAQLERLAASLEHKRRRAVAASVPHSARLWPALGERYVALLRERPARIEDLDATLGPGPSELLRLLAPLRAAAAADLEAPVWIADLLALELARTCSRRDGRARALRCRYAVHELLLACDRGWLGVALEPAAHAYQVDATRLRWRALEDPA